MEKWEGRQVGRRQVITFRGQKSDFVAEIVAPPSSSSLHAGLYLGSAAFGVKPHSYKSGFRLEFPTVWQRPIKTLL